MTELDETQMPDWKAEDKPKKKRTEKKKSRARYPHYLADLPISRELKAELARELEVQGWGDPIAKYNHMRGQVQQALMNIYFTVTGEKSTDLVTAIQKYVHASTTNI